MHRPTILVLAAAALSVAAGNAAGADLQRPIVKAPPAPLPPPMYNWTGFYGGVNLGGSFGRQNVTATRPGTTVTHADHLNGVIGGGQVGYNWQWGGPWVFGFETDIQGSGESKSSTLAAPGFNLAYQNKLEWFGTARGRVGYALGDRGTWLPYVTGGLAYGESKISGSQTLPAPTAAFSRSDTRAGWTVGAGVEWAFAPQWSAKLEYLYVDLGKDPTIAVTPTTTITTGHLTDNIARVGVNYHF
jgi:outer membrane immunogenic protein